MGIFSRMTDIIHANLNAMLDKAEDPEKIVRLMVQEMEDTLVEARTAAARAIADKKVEGQVNDVDEGLAKLNADIASLEEKLADARNRQKSLVLRQNTASKQLEVRRQIYDNKFDDALTRFEKFERKMDHVEGRVEAYEVGLH